MLRARRFRGDDEGVSNVITTILLFSLFMIVFSTIVSIYIPSWSKSREYEHSLNVTEDFIQLKNTMDMQLLRDDTDVTMSTAVEVGYPGLPINGMGSVNGIISVLPTARSYNITVVNTTDNMQLGYGYGSIKYTSIYSNFPPQTYAYENGALILKQGSNSLVLSDPHYTASIIRSYLLSDTGSSEPLQPSGGYGYYDSGNTNTSDDSQVSFSFDGNTGRGFLRLEARNIDNSSSVSVWVDDGNTERFLAWLEPTPAGGAWANQTIEIPNSYMTDEGWNANTLIFKTNWTDPWQIRNITILAKTITLSTTLVSFVGSENSLGGADVKIVETTLLGKQTLYYSSMSRNITIWINSTYYQSWIDMINDTMTEQGFVFGDNYNIQVADVGTGDNPWGLVRIDVYYVDVLNIQNAVFRVKLI